VQVRYTFGNMVVSQTRTPSTSPSTSFYAYDAHGNVAFLTDATGAETATYGYDAWGNVVASSGSTSNPRLFAGEELDPDVGLINLRAREYGPETGRFWTIDPIAGDLARPATLNRYLYGNADPVRLIDPTGQFTAGEYAMMLTVAAALVKRFAPIPADSYLSMFPDCLLGGSVVNLALTLGKVVSGPIVTFSYYGICAAITGLSYVPSFHP
jgi:RHS repeat-associated protein